MTARFRVKQAAPLGGGILRMTTWIDPIQPNHGVVPYQVVAATAGIGPHGPTRRAGQGDRLPIEVNVPPARVERQHRQFAATARTAQVDRSVPVTDPDLPRHDDVKRGHYLDEDRAQSDRIVSPPYFARLTPALSNRNLCRNDVESERY